MTTAKGTAGVPEASAPVPHPRWWAVTGALLGVGLGYYVHRKWLALPGLVTLFLFQHAVQGWCPPVPILRRLGFRTVYEIEQERQALKALRGDFAEVTQSGDRAAAAIAAARLA